METGIILFLVGTIVGLVAGAIRLGSGSIGTLRVVHADEEKPYLFLELDKPVESLPKKEYVLMRVKHEQFESHE